MTVRAASVAVRTGERAWAVGEEAAEPIVRAAADGGVTFFDTADAVGATRQGHIEDALGAGELTLAEDEISRLEEPYLPHPVLGHQ